MMGGGDRRKKKDKQKGRDTMYDQQPYQGVPQPGAFYDPRMRHSHENLAQAYRPSMVVQDPSRMSMVPSQPGGYPGYGPSPGPMPDMQASPSMDPRADRLVQMEQMMESFQGVLNNLVSTLSKQEDRLQQIGPIQAAGGGGGGGGGAGAGSRPRQASVRRVSGQYPRNDPGSEDIRRFVMATPHTPESPQSGRRRSFFDDRDRDEDDDALLTVFKKSSANDKVTLFLGKREIVDHGSKQPPVLEGVIFADLEFVGNLKVFVQLMGSFEYGTADLDILGLSFQKDLYRSVQQVYPPPEDDTQRTLSQFQLNLMEKLGSDHAFPFWFEIAPNTPSSVTLQPYGSDGVEEAPCGIFYALEGYVAHNKDSKPEKRSKVKMNVCKFSLTPLTSTKSIPTVEDTFSFLMSSGSVKVQGQVDKSVYLHDEVINIDVTIRNDSSKIVKHITVSVIQNAEIFLGTQADYDVTVVKSTCHEGFPLGSGKEWTRQFRLCPADQQNRDGFALDGALKGEGAKLASSTYMRDKMANKENMGIVVNYLVEVRLIMQGARDVNIRIPFALTHAPVRRRRGSIYASSKPHKEKR